MTLYAEALIRLAAISLGASGAEKAVAILVCLPQAAKLLAKCFFGMITTSVVSNLRIDSFCDGLIGGRCDY